MHGYGSKGESGKKKADVGSTRWVYNKLHALGMLVVSYRSVVDHAFISSNKTLFTEVYPHADQATLGMWPVQRHVTWNGLAVDGSGLV